MSQRTPSHWRAMRLSSPSIASLQGRVAVVQLERVRPAVEVGVAPVSQDARAVARLDAAVVLGLRGELLLRPRHEEVRVLGHPGVVRRHVVRDEVEDEAQAPALEAPAEPGERLVSAEVLVDPVVPDREAGAADVCLAKVGEDAVVLGEPLGLRPRDAPGRLAGLPDAEEPDEVEPVRGQPVELRVGDVVERRLSPQRGRELREPDPRVDLEERGIPRCGHGSPRAWMRQLTSSPPTCCRTTRASSFSLGVSSASWAVTRPKRSRRRATRPVQPVWWLAPMPAPLSPWKYS